MLSNDLKQKLIERIGKDKLVIIIKKDPDLFLELIKIALSDDQPQAWRAAWLLNHLIKKNDNRIIPFIDSILDVIKNRKDGHQRELLKIIMVMELEEDQESNLFDICINIWEDIYKSSSVRITAFKVLGNIIKKYPELINEIEALTQDHYTESLSSGIKRSFQRIKKEISNSNY